jgi:hypothetical protein
MYKSLPETLHSYHVWQAVFFILIILAIAALLLIAVNKSKIQTGSWAFLLDMDSFFLNILVVAWLLAMNFCGMVLCMKVAEDHAQTWLEPELIYLNSNAKINPPVSCSTCVPLYQRIENQFKEAKDGARMHLEVTIYYYSRYFMAVTMGAILGIIAGIFLIFITNAGWGTTSWLVRNVFILSTVCAAFFTSMPLFFEQEDNIDKNKDLYVSYKGMQNSLQSFTANCGAITCDSVNKYVNTIDKKLFELGKFPLKFNRNAIDFSKTIQSINNTANLPSGN